MRRNCDRYSSRHVMDLMPSTTSVTGLALSLPAAKPGTPQWSYTVVEGDKPPHFNVLHQCDLVLGWVMSSASGGVVSQDTTAYFEVYQNDVLVESQKSDLIPSGQYGDYNFEVVVEVGDDIDVYMWASIADEIVLDERHYAFIATNVWPVKDKRLNFDRTEVSYIPQMSGRVGAGSGSYLHNKAMTTYNECNNVDSDGGDFIIEMSSTGYGIARPYSTYPNVTVANHTSRLWPVTQQEPVYLEFMRMRD